MIPGQSARLNAAVNPTFRFAQSLLTFGLLLCSASLAISVLGGKVFSLQRDEIYFLHEAYAMAQGWQYSSVSWSFPYDLYVQWLSLALREGAPESLWSAVALDTGAQIVCGILLTMLAFRRSHRSGWLGIFAILAGALLFFSIGRLADHRPDYLAVTFLALGAFSLVKSFSLPNERIHGGFAWVAGSLFAISACFSPRSLVVLACALPLIALWTVRNFDLVQQLRAAMLGVLGFLTAIVLVWAVTGFSLWSSLAWLVSEREGMESWINMVARFTDQKRLVMVIMNAGVLIGATWLYALHHRSSGMRLFAWAAASFALAQFFLILFDGRIYVYAYSYGLVAYLLLIVPLTQALRGNQPRLVAASSTVILGGFTVLLLSQITIGYEANSISYLKNISLRAHVNKTFSTGRLVDIMGSNSWILAGLRARILLCERFEGYRFLSNFPDGPICLRSGFVELAEQNEMKIPRGKATYGSGRQLRVLLRTYDVPRNHSGMLFDTDEKGRVTDIVPLR